VRPVDVVSAFGEACNAHDLDGAIGWCDAEIVFEGTSPPDGLRLTGHDSLRELWAPMFANPATRIDVEETIEAGDRVVQRCRYSWGEGHVRAVDVYRVADDKIKEKLSYVKG
jgi:hypothetical protein